MSTATFLDFMSTSGYLDAGKYKCAIVYTNSTNQEYLSNEACKRVEIFGKQCNGVLESRVVSNPRPEIIRYEEVFTFLNRESLLTFAQNVGFLKLTYAIDFQVDFQSLQLLL